MKQVCKLKPHRTHLHARTQEKSVFSVLNWHSILSTHITNKARPLVSAWLIKSLSLFELPGAGAKGLVVLDPQVRQVSTWAI